MPNANGPPTSLTAGERERDLWGAADSRGARTHEERLERRARIRLARFLDFLRTGAAHRSFVRSAGSGIRGGHHTRHQLTRDDGGECHDFLNGILAISLLRRRPRRIRRRPPLPVCSHITPHADSDHSPTVARRPPQHSPHLRSHASHAFCRPIQGDADGGRQTADYRSQQLLSRLPRLRQRPSAWAEPQVPSVHHQMWAVTGSLGVRRAIHARLASPSSATRPGVL
jgi:hypothetical protein